MKRIAGFEQDLGTHGGKAKGDLGIDGNDAVIQIQARYPLQAIIEPVGRVIDQLVDKLEAVIPGDQKEMAAKAKAEVRAQLVKALSEQPDEVQG